MLISNIKANLLIIIFIFKCKKNHVTLIKNPPFRRVDLYYFDVSPYFVNIIFLVSLKIFCEPVFIVIL